MPAITMQPWWRATTSTSSPVPALVPAPTAAGWAAHLGLVFEGRGVETVLVGRRHRGPLRVQRPFLESSGVCQAYVLHPPGGVVGGDTLHVDVRVEKQGRALVTTPGATKFYRSAGATAYQTQHVRVDDDCCIEWLPQETILFAGARAESNTVIQLATAARGIGWEITCLGRPASGERFDRGSFRQRLQWIQDERPLLTEAVHYSGADEALDAAWGFQGRSKNGTMIVHPVTDSALALARQTALPLSSNDQFGASQLAQGGQQHTLVCRYLGSSAERCKQMFTRIWQRLRPTVMGIEVEVPRVWRT